jgi:quercetin dioxygenase-like cupin family protein
MDQPNEGSNDNQPPDSGLPGVEFKIVAETDDLRVTRITMEAGGVIPWHHHTHVADRFFCTEGEMTVETHGPPETHLLTPGSELTVPAMTAHVVSNVGAKRCRFVLVQGMGAYDRVPGDAPAP